MEFGRDISNKEKNCIRNGRYCQLLAFSQSADRKRLADHVTGRMIVIENLFQECIWRFREEYNREDIWWDYVTNFDRMCGVLGEKHDEMFTSRCRKNVVDLVMKNFNGDSAVETDNTSLGNVFRREIDNLEDLRVQQEAYSVKRSPHIKVNGHEFSGQ